MDMKSTAFEIVTVCALGAQKGPWAPLHRGGGVLHKGTVQSKPQPLDLGVANAKNFLNSSSKVERRKVCTKKMFTRTLILARCCLCSEVYRCSSFPLRQDTFRQVFLNWNVHHNHLGDSSTFRSPGSTYRIPDSAKLVGDQNSAFVNISVFWCCCCSKSYIFRNLGLDKSFLFFN